MGMHTNWRDCAAWQKEKLPLSTASNEACKLFDAALTQYVGWYDDAQFGGLEQTLEKLKQADPDFAMGQAFYNGIVLMGTGDSVALSAELRSSVDKMVASAASQPNLTEREKDHIRAVHELSQGHISKATVIWENLLINHPTDLLALKFAHDAYFYLGQQRQIRDSIARVLPRWNSSAPLYGYLHGMLAFGYVETNFHELARRSAEKALSLNERDAWATHALAHVFEMDCQPDQGIAMMSKTVQNWETCNLLACHNFWHWALFHVEKGENEAAIEIFDGQVGKRVSSGAMLDYVDAASLLYRLKLDGTSVDDRWAKVYDVAKPHLNDHILAFNDAHFLMACLGTRERSSVKDLLESATKFVESPSATGDTARVTREVGLPLMEAMVKHGDGDYGAAAEDLLRIRYDIVKIGGSNAQRDVFELLLLDSAIRSDKERHRRVAEALLTERGLSRPNSPMLKRLCSRLR
ncbi:tetratricopeptide repeat protein 38-like [Ornithodoros turicata]|uniref:tetratricopeptide repeat protein 38-like n=1 Tax=Ornithodoros turicata TaxID=34597 RepID=UPI003139C327